MNNQSLFLILCFQILNYWDYASCFLVSQNHQHKISDKRGVKLSTENNNNNNDDKKGYQFGDITKSLAKKLLNEEDKEKKGYQFGDVSKSLGKKLASRVNDLTEKEGEYEFGDLSRWIDGKVKENVNKFTGKESEYEFGDLTKELVRRASTHNYDLEELFMIMKAIMSLGVSFSPVAGMLPVKVLVEMLNFSLLNDVGNKAVGAITHELDRRMKKAITGDSDYQLGDKTKEGIKKFIGKEEYQFGDISKTVLEIVDENNKKSSSSGSASAPKLLEGSKILDAEFEKWDESLWKSERK